MFCLGGLRHFVGVPAGSIDDVKAWRDALRPYTWASITNWYFIQTDAFDDDIQEPGEVVTVETYLRADFETSDRETRRLKIPAPKSENFEDKEDRGNRVTDAAGSALASIYQHITGEQVSFVTGALYGGSPLR